MKAWTVEHFKTTESFEELRELVSKKLRSMEGGSEDRRAMLEKERKDLQEQTRGWQQSLGKADLNRSVRESLESAFGAAIDRIDAIQIELAQFDSTQRDLEELVDAEKLVNALNRLDEILASNNPSGGNVALSQHIEAIRCYPNGRVTVRTCKLGALAGSVDLAQGEESNKVVEVSSTARATPKRLAVRDISHSGIECEELKAAAEVAADVDRFAGLSDEWFWIDEFQLPPKTSWAVKNSQKAAELRMQGLTMRQIAKRLGRSVPIIRLALKAAKECLGEAGNSLPYKMPRQNWSMVHAREVAELHSKGMSTTKIAAHFGKSDTTIRTALALAKQMNQ